MVRGDDYPDVSMGHLVEANIASVVLSRPDRANEGSVSPTEVYSHANDGIMCGMIIALANLAFETLETDFVKPRLFSNPFNQN